MYYLSSDHLGSINLIVDGSNGNVVDDLSYDSWGRNRNPIDWSYSNFTHSSITDRGYTSHEQLTNFGLINMPVRRNDNGGGNGRIYDPMTLGFLSPDPFVQNPSNSQNYNRFSYVLNNPLKYVDPSGYVALNPWYQYQAGPKTFYTWMPDYHTDGTYPDNQGRIWKYHGETINTPGFYGDETGMWISKLNEHNELTYNYNELRQIVQNNANSNSFFSSFSMGAGTFRVEGEGNGINQGLDFSLAKMYLHFQIGGGKPLIIKTNTIDFKNATQKKLGLSGIQKGDIKQVNLFDLEVNSTSLAFGKIDMKYLGDNKFSIMPNYFDFNIEWEAGFSSRNVGTVIGGAINYNLMINPAAAIVPLIFGGPYEVIFYGTITIPE